MLVAYHKSPIFFVFIRTVIAKNESDTFFEVISEVPLTHFACNASLWMVPGTIDFNEM